ncbi:nucleotide-binding protein [Halomonas sp. SpR1]|uniref:TIR domain-containing protein n=1 Tax=Halomonas sp. SpR1 TaxID=3050462 RepID=UPI0027E4CDD9|nr:TIR domain-containing protein [Halomonas sp. SpR1]MDQ7733110.1 nucleotide-binding protein [Halomonas sp. SpR1]
MAKDEESKPKRARISQSDFPRESLARALSIAQAIWDNFAGKDAPPHEIALALDLSPTSGGWRNMCGTSIAYGLTEGGYNANSIALTELGRRIVAPTTEGDDAAARVEAILQPRIMGEFFQKYNKAKFPKESIAENVLVGMGIPKERANRAVQLIHENGIYAGVLRDTKTGLFVALGSPAPQPDMEQEEEQDMMQEVEQNSDEGLDAVAKRVSGKKEPAEEPETHKQENNNVFISHGKNKKIVTQLKELLTFGKLNPIVSVEKDTASVPVPEKVFNDMRQCGAAVIHVSKEGELLDTEGNTHTRINENVLIEIGAAIALYKNRFVLLVEKGVNLPSNLQGLYRCEYEGDQLDYEATMKLLKTFNEFR